MNDTRENSITDKRRFRAYHLLVICCLATLLSMAAHRFFPDRHHTLVPNSDVMAFIYMDESASGRAHIEWIDEQALKWRCVVEADGQEYTCGFHVVIGGGQGTEGLDLSRFTAVNVDLDYRGTDQRLRFYMRNYEPGFSDINRIETAKFNYVSIPIQFLDEPLVIQLAEFTVAEWWINAYQVPRHLAQTSFEHVTSFGIDLTYPAPVGVHEFQLRKLEFVGPWISAEHWYLSILLFWITIILLLGATQLIRLRRAVALERRRRESLASQNQDLALQSIRYKQLSMMDPLTGMLNRQGVADYVEREFPSGTSRLVSLLVMDIDHFKKINDTLGHEGGDRVLCVVADLIRSHIRQSDCAGRWGGEEFVVILPDTGTEGARAMAEKLRRLLQRHQFPSFPELRVTASIGVGSHTGERSFHHLFRRADTALYRAKAQGRNQTVVAQDIPAEEDYQNEPIR